MFVGGMFFKQKHVVSHNHPVPENEKHVTPGRVLLTAKFQETPQGFFGIRFVPSTRSFGTDLFFRVWRYRRIVGESFRESFLYQLSDICPIPPLFISP